MDRDVVTLSNVDVIAAFSLFHGGLDQTEQKCQDVAHVTN